MNTDFIVLDEPIRTKHFLKNINSSGDTKYYSDSCDTIDKYAKEQNTIYNPETNQILYGINSNMHVSGVSDGTCNQINPLIYSKYNICGAGTAGANRCVPQAYPQAYQIENFDASKFCDICDLVWYIISFILLGLLISIVIKRNFR